MNDYPMLPISGLAREREKKRKLRAEAVSWQRVAVGVLAMSTALNAAQQAAIIRRDAEAAQLQARYDLAVAIEHDAVQAYGGLLRQVEAEKEARAAQAAAYDGLAGYRYIGECTITAYCPCGECCGKWADGMTATGIPAVHGIVAVDPNVIQIGSTVIIDGQRYLAADTGVTGEHVDICVTDHREAADFGVRAADVWMVQE